MVAVKEKPKTEIIEQDPSIQTHQELGAVALQEVPHPEGEKYDIVTQALIDRFLDQQAAQQEVQPAETPRKTVAEIRPQYVGPRKQTIR